ncbi:hypothetical protein ABB37_05242 [Leptomonas pyrrhocoris]|uniref:Uncharacterized protein n=1 Tax=Leptomonas pyrrhocoris TaxID=157538 RepID=A0A0N0DUT3_LEPPY|nr:hypothetical protein ABB37_05242 [Leptomonas pyrrhocoris]KPA79392.1 hypothetical protein ABB37_05242 [Leptomonas pyrrhocoris]|eukprot:XP_015657831.1 hypothetical protein ABB37_05242 [Leptomonas pyrrhocoris]
MIRRLTAMPARWAATAASSIGASSRASMPRWCATKNEAPADDAEFEFFEDDLWFLDEMFDESAGDLFSYIPEADANLLGNDQATPK